MKQYEEALNDIKEAIKLSPSDKNLRDEYEAIKASKKKETDHEKELARQLFSQGLYNEKSAPSKPKKVDGLPEFKQENPQVFFDLEVGTETEPKTGRVVFELFPEQVPKTAENFRALCTGEKGEGLHYRGNIFHRIIKDFMMQGGDITNQNGTGGKSIYGHKFNDEGVWLQHVTPGLLSMANSGPNTNGSQFFITYKATPWLDNKHTVFGRVIKGFEICRTAEQCKTGGSDLPVYPIKIADCGELKEEEKVGKE